MFGRFKKSDKVTIHTAFSAPPLTEPEKRFSRCVGSGFVDHAGTWFATQHEAETSTARQHMCLRIGDYALSRMIGNHLPNVEPLTVESLLAEPDVVRAMAVLGAPLP